MNKIITRFPPSPTGEIHIGNMRTMLFNFLYAKHYEGEVFLRFEDTDKERSDAKYEPIVIDALHTLGLDFDHGPFRQSERTFLYSKKLQELLDLGVAYEGEESSDGSGNRVIRFKNPNKTITFDDKIRGTISIESSIFGDFVIARNINNPIYHFAVVVDDIEMGITHIIRGEDHITSTPRQILLIEALGGIIPVYAHLPLIVGEDRKKLSKRHGAVSVSAFIRQGYLPDAIVNYLAFLGWNPGGEREIYSLKELIQEFTLEKVGKSAATFNYSKLNDINYHYMLQLPFDDYMQHLINFLPEDIRQYFIKNPNIAERVMEKVIKQRIDKFSDVTLMAENDELSYYFIQPKINSKLVGFKGDSEEKTKELLLQAKIILEKIKDIDWNIDFLKSNLWAWSAQVGRGNILHPLRVILSGKNQSPDPFTMAYVLGKNETLKRIDYYLLKCK